MNIKFTKMHGLGNDFMVLDAIHQQINFTREQINFLSKRDVGVGFDQCLLVEKSDHKEIDFFYRIFNADGQEVGQCGNGARCLARFLHHYKLTDKTTINVATATTILQLHINENDTVTVNMGIPNLAPKKIPLHAPAQQIFYQVPKEHLEFHALSIGNPHAILLVDNVHNANVDIIGKHLSEHKLFPQQTNVGFMQIMNNKLVNLRVYERGCGETNACGSGAVAAVAAGRLFHNLSDQVTVNLRGGKLLVSWKDLDGPIYLTGPATFVYEGEIMGDLCA